MIYDDSLDMNIDNAILDNSAEINPMNEHDVLDHSLGEGTETGSCGILSPSDPFYQGDHSSIAFGDSSDSGSDSGTDTQINVETGAQGMLSPSDVSFGYMDLNTGGSENIDSDYTGNAGADGDIGNLNEIFQGKSGQFDSEF